MELKSITVIADDSRMEEFLSKQIPAGITVHRVTKFEEAASFDSPVCFDLSFEATAERIKFFLSQSSTIFFVNCVHLSDDQLQQLIDKNNSSWNIIRINGWPGFFGRNIIEASSPAGNHLLEKLGWQYKNVPDQPGLISARIIAMIINEAYLTLGEGVTTKKEADIAMKLGTNYPFGPFEWCEKIGIKNIYALLNELGKTNEKYTPAPLLKKEAFA